MLKKSHYIILILVVLLVLVLLQLPGATVGKLKLAISGLFLPLFGLSNSTQQWLGQARQGLVPRRELLRQLDQLRRDNQDLKLRLSQDAQLENENARLRAQVGWARHARWPVKLGRVMARDPANWWRSLEIDLGSRDGLRTNLAVLTPDGLVGRVQSVSATRSQVILLGDPNLRVAAKVAGAGPGPANAETGIIAVNSSAPQEQGMIDLDLLSGASGVEPGQNVETWGAGGVFPADIPIGKIVDIQTNGLSVEARVKLAVNLSALEEVWVVLP